MKTSGFLYMAAALAAESVWAADFKREVTPILKKHCYECHSVEAGKEKAGYVFDDLDALKIGIGPKGFIVPNNPRASYLMEVITMDVSEKAHMPPNEMLSQREISKIREWIEAGAELGPASAKPAAATTAALALMDWTNAEGKTIKAGFVRLEGENVILKMPTNGQEIPYPLSKLSAESQEQAKNAATGR